MLRKRCSQQNTKARMMHHLSFDTDTSTSTEVEEYNRNYPRDEEKFARMVQQLLPGPSQHNVLVNNSGTCEEVFYSCDSSSEQGFLDESERGRQEHETSDDSEDTEWKFNSSDYLEWKICCCECLNENYEGWKNVGG